MITIFRWMMWILTAAFVLILLVGGGVYYLASRSIPDYDRDHVVRGLNRPVEIIRDTYAIPHIFAQNDADVMFGLGFSHAQDRLWQMILMRRTVQGRLAEAFGEDALPTDEYMRALDLYTIAQKAVAFQTPETILMLEAYSAGINALIRDVSTEALGRGAPQFFIAPNQIAPWQPADSIALIKLMALQLSDQASREVLRARLSLALPKERVSDFFSDPAGEAIMAVPDFASLFPETPTEFAKADPYIFDPIQPIDLAGASNTWAALGSRSASGSTLLATDPHMPLYAPGYWMVARLEFSDGGAIGGTIPGIPGILIGRNANMGWGITSSYLDDQDIVVEKLNPQNSDEYLTEDGYLTFETRDILIGIKDQVSVARRLRWSQNGPVLPSHRLNLAAITPAGHVATMSWTAFEEDDQTVEALMNVMRQRNVDDAVVEISKIVSPSNIFTLADKDNILQVAGGRMPARAPDHPTQGQMPTPGWDKTSVWEGVFPFDTNPYIKNPESGIVVNTNNKIIDRAFPLHFSYEWGDTQRIARATSLLNAREFHTLNSFMEIQTDIISITARNLLPLIARDLWWTGQPAATDSFARRRQEALELLANWNGEMGEHDPEPLIYAAWIQALQKRLIVDELGKLSGELTRIKPDFIEAVFRNEKGAGVWCDIQQTTAVETCQQMAEVSLDEALLRLEETYGKNIARWRWGTAHQALHTAQVLGRIPVVSWFANIRQETPGGDNTLLRGATRGTGSAPFTNVHGSGFRAVYDFSDLDSSVMIIATGQSGHLLSPFYDDLSALWRRGEYIPMSLDPEVARGGAVGITRLAPSR
ncbi:MAG: penicillin acylase family protein [Rhodobacteraceae bacterium]|nr:MAG: penicillin acylase family protein [Paracoccaceae bacterium]